MPRSTDELGIDLSQLPEDAYVVFFSHRWLEPESGNPDDTNLTKYKQIISSTTELLVEQQVDPDRCYLWVDYHSVNQENTAGGVNALLLYVQVAAKSQATT